MVPASVPGGPGRGAVPVAAGGGGSRLRQRGRSGARLRVEPLHQPRPHRLDPSPAGGGVGVPLVPDPFRHSGHRCHRVRAVGRARPHRPCRPEPAGRVDHVMPREIGADGDPSVAGLLEALAADDNQTLRLGDQVWSWRQVVSAGAVRTSLLRSMSGAGPPHVGVLLGNVPEYLFWLGAAALAGAVVVGINPTRRGDELAGDILRTDCRLIVTDAEGAQLLDGLCIGAAADRVLRIDGAAYLHLLEQHQGADPHAIVADADPVPADLFLLLFTSGTTGTPKAVRCTQGRLASIGMRSAAAYGFERDDVAYCAMPLFHGNALMALWAPSLVVGLSLIHI